MHFYKSSLFKKKRSLILFVVEELKIISYVGMNSENVIINKIITKLYWFLRPPIPIRLFHFVELYQVPGLFYCDVSECVIVVWLSHREDRERKNATPFMSFQALNKTILVALCSSSNYVSFFVHFMLCAPMFFRRKWRQCSARRCNALPTQWRSHGRREYRSIIKYLRILNS